MKLLKWTFTFILLGISWAQAYQLTCNWVFIEDVDAFRAPQSPQKILKAIEQYKKIMKIKNFNHKPAGMDEVKMRLKSLTPKEREMLFELIGSLYNEVKSLKYNNEGPFKTFKRHIDLAISEEINAPAFFKKEFYGNHHSLAETLDLYYLRVHELTKIPVILKGDDVLYSAIQLQDKFLKQKDSPIVIYGSFVNGKAYTKSSDLDFAVLSGALEAQMREENLLELLTEFPLSEAQAHVIRAQGIHTLGSMNPLVLIVRKDYMVLRVYQSGLHSDFLGKKVRFDEY